MFKKNSSTSEVIHYFLTVLNRASYWVAKRMMLERRVYFVEISVKMEFQAIEGVQPPFLPSLIENKK